MAEVILAARLTRIHVCARHESGRWMDGFRELTSTQGETRVSNVEGF